MSFLEKSVFRLISAIVSVILAGFQTLPVLASAEPEKEYTQKSDFWQWAGSVLQD